MADDTQKILAQILDDLRSPESARQLAGMSELEKINYSSPAILSELERLAIRGSEEVPKAALAALSLRTSQFVASQLNNLSKYDRQLVLDQISDWETNDLIEHQRAEVLRRRYDYDIKLITALPATPPAIQEQRPAIQSASVPVPPRPSLMQTLLSEASIKIYLYLGAFFVIASALILAALVQAARLPILAVATLAFGGGALAIHKRLPQPSFALFIVFSFLLPIDANVLEETIHFTEPSLSIYWTLIFLMMTVIWGLSVWFYTSRFFSAVAFVSLSLAFYRAAQIFNTETELQILLGLLASLTGLAGTFILRKWKDNKFSALLFWLAQLQVIGLLCLSLGFVIIHILDSDISRGWWLLITVTWLAAAVFYAVSDLLTPIFFFPWLAAGVLLPLPWFFLNTFEVTQPIYAIGFWVWGTMLAAASEAAFRLPFEKTKRYHWALLASSIPLFLTGFAIALLREEHILPFVIFALTAFVYASLHLLRPRWYVWSAALLSALGAYFTFFYLPGIARLEFPLVYQLAIASALLVLPELFMRSPLSLRSTSRWPAVTLGAVVSLFGITLALTDLEHPGRGGAVLSLYAVLFTLHALHSKREWLGYCATAAGALALVYALDHFNLDLWLPALSVLALLYYVAGYFFRRRLDDIKAWGNVLINSGLTLGVLLSLTALILLKETSGWYIIVIALLFAIEVFARPLVWLEVTVEVLLSISLYLILADFKVTQIGHFLFGASLIWLSGDLIFKRLSRQKRIYRPIVLIAGYVLAGIGTFVLWNETNPLIPAIYFSLYVVFFALYAFLQGEPRQGYLATAFLPLTVLKFCNLLEFEKWIFPLISLAVLYYAAGYWLRRNQNTSGWDKVLLYSGLGLGAITSFGAPLQGGLDASIPVAVGATLFAAEAFALHNVWWALPANALYLMSYFMILTELHVDEPQYYSIGAALLGMFMHYLLTRAGSKTGAFIAGMLSQFVLLGTTYFQMLSTEKLSFFFVLFVQSMVVLIYGLIQRSRSLVITPIVFAVLGVITVVYSALKGLGPVILIGSTGVILLMAGIVAVLLRERITRLGEQLNDWKP
ncbi:MAG TPA: hypothetical protein VK249_22690 [Anaerolineales bacterium]|nr:hypothetical protein [Anaerolineales bacterium]